MPKFTKLDPSTVHVGRGRAAFEARQKFVEQIKNANAGSIELEKGDKPETVKRLLTQAAKDAGFKVRSTWETPQKKMLFWKRTRGAAQSK